MSNYRDDQLDELIEEALGSALERIDVPPVDEAWEKFEARYGSSLFDDQDRDLYLANLIEKNTVEKQSANSNEPKIKAKSYRTRVLRNMAIACILILVLTITIAKPQKAAAMGEWLLQFFRLKTGETTENIQRFHSNTGQQAGSYEEIKMMETSLPELQKKCPFKIGLPGYLPDKVVEQRYYYQEINNVFLVQIRYSAEDGKVVLFEQQQMKGENAFTKGNDTDDSMSKIIKIKGNDALLFDYKNGIHDVMWDNKSVLFRLRGELYAEEIIKIAESIEIL